MARLIGEWLSERLGQQFIVDDRPGAASNIGTEMVAKAAADGYTAHGRLDERRQRLVLLLKFRPSGQGFGGGV